MPGRRAIKPAEMYGIARSKSKNGKPLCWKVTLRRRGLILHKSFHDQTWDGAENALAAAKRYRDAMVQLVPPLTMLEYVQNVKTNNTSGFAGVYFHQRRSGARSWSARIQLTGGKIVSKTFAESIYGSRARELAIQARQEMLKLVDDTRTFTFSPGAIAETILAEFPAALPRPPRALTVRVQRLSNSGGAAHKSLYVSVSDALSPPVVKKFSTGLYGQAGALRLAMQVALDAVTRLGGEEVAQIFMRDYVEKYKRLPKKGISARIHFVPVEDAKKQDIAKAQPAIMGRRRVV